MQGHKYWKESQWNATDSIYTFETGSAIEFFSTDNADKLRGARRDRLFINEANNVTFDAFEQLEVRTKEFVIIDYNPTNEFWAHTEIKAKRSDVDFIVLTYKDNEGLSKEIVDSIEQRKNRTQWWQVYGLGQIGEIESRIYTGWNEIESIPFEAKLERRGLDFGYTNDPSALVAIYRYNGGFILDEELYSKGLSNKSIADAILNLEEPRTLVVADSSEPKSIDELKAYNINVIPTVKGPGSVNQGIAYVQDQKISITKRSLNLLREYRSYIWITDKDNRVVNTPVDYDNHALDALRYALSSYRPLQALTGEQRIARWQEKQRNIHKTSR
jgi:phage terminase large subunit